MTSQTLSQCDTRWRRWVLVAFALLLWPGSPASAADEPDLIFRRSTVFKLLSPNDKLATYGVDDPEVEGVACHFTVPEKGGFTGWLGLAEQVSDISLACRQIGPIHFKDKMEQGDDMFQQRRSLFFKKMQIVRGCDAKRNVLVYMVYSDKLIDGSPKNSTSSVPIMPWGASDTAVPEMRRVHPVSGILMRELTAALDAGRTAALGPRLGIAAAHQTHEFLRRRLVAATDVAALLRHRAGNPGPFRPQGIVLIDPRLGSRTQNFNRWLAGFAGRVFIANIDVAIAHDCHPLLEVRPQRATAWKGCKRLV